MENVDSQNSRSEALGHAVRHRLATETPDDVVAAAQKYLEFLEPNSQ